MLGPLYHWSPRERLPSIKRLGLVPGRLNFVSDDGFRQPMLCFSLDPATAWAYSHAVWKSAGTFDLWQVWLQSEDEVHVQPGWGDRIVEVRVANRIRKRRLVWIGERSV